MLLLGRVLFAAFIVAAAVAVAAAASGVGVYGFCADEEPSEGVHLLPLHAQRSSRRENSEILRCI